MRRSTNPEIDSQEDDAIVMTKPEGKAKEDALAVLHGVIAEYLTLKLMTGRATAAEVGAAITFLKNNSITADPATNAALADLRQKLKDRRDRKGGLNNKAMEEAEGHFSNLMGGLGMPQ